MQQNQWNDIMHCHRRAEFVYGPHAIGIAVGGQPHERSGLKHALFQGAEILVNWFWTHSAKEWITIGANSFHLKLCAGERTLNPGSTRPVHWISNYERRRSA